MSFENWTLVITKPLEESGLARTEIVEGVQFVFNNIKDDEDFGRVATDDGRDFFVMVDRPTKRVLALTTFEAEEYMREQGIGFRIEADEGMGRTGVLHAGKKKKRRSRNARRKSL